MANILKTANPQMEINRGEVFSKYHFGMCPKVEMLAETSNVQ